jgi:pyruvate-formate lyase-activating enzyme
MLDRMRRRYKATGFTSLFQSAAKISHDKIINILLCSNPKLCRYIAPKLEIICIELTNYCNLKCQFCIRDTMTRKLGFMPFSLFEKIIDQLDRNTTLALYFGGESLLHPRFIDMVEYAVNKHFREIRFTTNGMLFTPEIMDAIIKCNVDVMFSLEGMGEVNDKVRIGDHFPVILRNIQFLVKNRNKSKISLNMVEADQTSEQINEFISFFKGTVDRILVNPLRDYVKVIKTDFYDGQETKQVPFCTMPFHFLSIMWNGDATACCYDLDGKIIVGNVNSQTIKQIWMGKPITNLRHACLTKTFPATLLCSACSCEKKYFVDTVAETSGLKITYQGPIKIYERKDEVT